MDIMNRTLSFYHKELLNVSIVNVEQQGDINQTDNTSDIAWGELDTLLTSLTQKIQLIVL